MPKGYGSTAASIARVGIGKVPRPRKPKKIRPTRPYTRKPRMTKPIMRVDPGTDIVPRTQTPTVSGTGVTTVDGGLMPGAPADIQSLTRAPTIRNYRKVDPRILAQGMLAPQYASLYAQQQQQQSMAGQQRSAISGLGAELAKILGAPGPGGVKGTLGPDFAAALAMSAMRNFAYQQFLTAQDYAGKYAEIAAQNPTLINQIVAQRFDQNLKMKTYYLQEAVAKATYHINLLKTKSYTDRNKALTQQGAQRLLISQFTAKTSRKQYLLGVSKYNKQVLDDANKINLRLSSAQGAYVNDQGVPIPKLKGLKPPPYYKPNAPGGGSGPGGGGMTPNERAGILDKATSRASALKAQDGITAPVIKRPKAYRMIRQYLHLQFKTLKPKQLNQLTEAALSAGGY